MNEAYFALAKKYLDEKLSPGYTSGGSKHLSHCSYSVSNIEEIFEEDKLIGIRVFYSILIETEFTCYPDNPPLEIHEEEFIKL
ncbi:MAG: hypothetical protein KKA07_12525 [Bacteroidetes bacterium]|nr:hypothetical protein [Bacteroidota bacterium]MBU1719883.1 hypothetical protein [Bacteroidota bacterium]